MIHSMAGGVVHENRRLDFAKVRLEDGSVRFYISKIADLQAGNSVIVPADGSFGFQNQFNAADSAANFTETHSTETHDANTMLGTNNTMRGVVLRVDKNVSEQVAPVPVKRCKEILRRCD